ncbi:hypothetical protein MHU86_24482 [Fragilaria crotonensis]|nr:hypothetical protein MHU86_24482 [Fragilaria crotonensis]
MLAADKLQLQSAMKQQATALKEKEFNLHHTNFMTVGTQAAVLAGLDVTMFIEFTPSPNSVWIYGNYRRVVRRFGFDESETVNFDDIFHGPAAIQVVRTGLRSLTNTFSGRNNKSKNTHQGTFVSDGDEENDDDSDNSPLVPEKSTNNARSKRRGVGKGENFV